MFAPFYFSASTVVPLNSQLFEWKHNLPLAFPVAQLVKNPPAMQETLVLSQSWEDPLEKGKATHFIQYSGLENSMDNGVAKIRD